MIGMSTHFDEIIAENTKNLEQLCAKTLSVLYPGKSIQWCIENRELIDSQYTLTIVRQKTNTGLLEYTIDVAVKNH